MVGELRLEVCLAHASNRMIYFGEVSWHGLGELPNPIRVRGDESVIMPVGFLNRPLLRRVTTAVLVAEAEVVTLSAGRC